VCSAHGARVGTGETAGANDGTETLGQGVWASSCCHGGIHCRAGLRAALTAAPGAGAALPGDEAPSLRSPGKSKELRRRAGGLREPLAPGQPPVLGCFSWGGERWPTSSSCRHRGSPGTLPAAGRPSQLWWDLREPQPESKGACPAGATGGSELGMWEEQACSTPWERGAAPSLRSPVSVALSPLALPWPGTGRGCYKMPLKPARGLECCPWGPASGTYLPGDLCLEAVAGMGEGGWLADPAGDPCGCGDRA